MKTNRDVTLPDALGNPPQVALEESRQGVEMWFKQAAPLIRWDRIETPIGPLYLAVTDRGLNRVGFNQPEASFFAQLDRMARAERDSRAVGEFAGQLVEYFDGRRKLFDLPLDWGGVGAFQRRALEAALAIPFGQTFTYQQLAQAIGKPKASRAIGQAMARNPIPVVVPCHRVLGSDGSLHGYAGGLERKAILLKLEGAM